MTNPAMMKYQLDNVIRKLYLEGFKSTREIAQELGISKTCIANRIQRMGISRKKAYPRRLLRLGIPFDFIIEEYCEKGKTIQAVASELGVSFNTIRNFLKKQELTRHPAPLNEAEILADYDKGKSVCLIAKEMQASYTRIRRIIRKYRIPRNLKEAITASIQAGFRCFPQREQCHQWKGGRKYHLGYIKIFMYEHPYADSHGYVFEHIVIWEKAHNKPLPRGWRIHHVNGVKDDNRPENLVALSDRKHKRILQIKAEKIQNLERRVAILEAEVTLLRKTLEKHQAIFYVNEKNP